MTEKGVDRITHNEIRNSELANVGTIKIVCMLFVVFGHSIDFWGGSWFPVVQPAFEFAGEKYLSTFVSGWHVYTFTLLSGFVFAYKMNVGGYSRYRTFLLNKVKRLVVPYVFAAAVWVVPLTQIFFHYDAVTLVKMYVLCIGPSQLWFLWMLFDIFAICWPLYALLVRRPWLGAGIALAFAGTGTVLQGRVPNIFCILSAFQNIPFFFLGIMLWENETWHRCLTRRIPSLFWLVAYLLFCLSSVRLNESSLMAEAGFLGRILRGAVRFVLSTVGALAMYTGMHKLLKRRRKTKERFAKLGKMTMPIYLFHQQVIYFTIVLLNGAVNPYIHAIVNFACALAVSGIISAVLLRGKTTRFLIGEK